MCTNNSKLNILDCSVAQGSTAIVQHVRTGNPFEDTTINNIVCYSVHCSGRLNQHNFLTILLPALHRHQLACGLHAHYNLSWYMIQFLGTCWNSWYRTCFNALLWQHCRSDPNSLLPEHIPSQYFTPVQQQWAISTYRKAKLHVLTQCPHTKLGQKSSPACMPTARFCYQYSTGKRCTMLFESLLRP